MKLLIQYEDKLLSADRARPENRSGVQEICRMTGSLTQSFFIFDSQNFKVARKIYYGLADDNNDMNDGDYIEQLVAKQNKEGNEGEEEEEYDDCTSKKSRKSSKFIK
jgi:hypothetical protein